MSFRVSLAAAVAAAIALPALAQPWAYPDRRDDRFGVQGGELVLYEHTQFQGRRTVLRGVEPDLRRQGFNDIASSAQSRGSWEVCEHINFQGRCWRVGGNEPSFVMRGFNDTISSARQTSGPFVPPGYPDRPGRPDRGRWEDDRERWRDRERGPRGGDARGGAVLYEHAGFGGRPVGIRDEEPDLTTIGFNDVASAIQIRRGAWRLCEHTWYRGTCIVVSSDVPRLSDYRLNDRISSIQRIE